MPAPRHEALRRYGLTGDEFDLVINGRRLQTHYGVAEGG